MGRYQEDALKLEYYKTEMIKEMARLGMSPNQLGITQRLAFIDEKLSVYRYSANKSGQQIDTKALKSAFNAIAMDLVVLYQAIINYRRSELKELKEFVEAKLSSMEKAADQYEVALSNDLACSALGKAIYIQTSNYNWSYRNGLFTLLLPNIKTSQNKALYFFLGAEEETRENALLSFTMDEESYAAMPFGDATRAVKTTKADNTKTYNFTKNTELSSGSILINCDGLAVDKDKRYTILAGKNYCLQDVGLTQQEIHCNMHESIPSDVNSEFSFTVYGGTYLRIDTSAAPIWSNLDTNKEVAIKKLQEVKFSMPLNSAWQIMSDGTVYAYSSTGVIEENKLYCPSSKAGNMTDFLVLEKEEDKVITLSDIKVTIASGTAEFPLINYIAIKEAATV